MNKEQLVVVTAIHGEIQSPPTWSGKDINQMLKEGWRVVHMCASSPGGFDDSPDITHVIYVVEK